MGKVGPVGLFTRLHDTEMYGSETRDKHAETSARRGGLAHSEAGGFR